MFMAIQDPSRTSQRKDSIHLRYVCLRMQHEDAENIGYIIPPPVIQHFITDFERNGRYTAFPALGVEWQKMESPFLRKALGMSVRHSCNCNNNVSLHGIVALVCM